MEERKIIAKILKKPLEDGALREALEEMKLKPTYENGILLQMVRKAAAGDLTAAKYILDTAKVPEDTVCSYEDLTALPTEVLRQMAAKEVKHGTS
ncbi:MAG: hypothetical protein J6J43_06535 [Oscillospiraceae bacterium]|nr:hypothetical protein [Oscillospiraceae bacterium]